MKSRERLLTALRHEEADRIPIDLGSTDVTGMNCLVYKGFRKLLNLPDKPIRPMVTSGSDPSLFTFYNMVAEVEREVLDILHIDVISINRTLEPTLSAKKLSKAFINGGWRIVEFGFKQWYWREWDLTIEIPDYIDVIEGEGRYIASLGGREHAIAPKKSFYFNSRRFSTPLKNAKDVNDIKDFNWDFYKISDIVLEDLKRRAEYLYKSTDYGLIYFRIGSIHAWPQDLRGWSQWLADLRLRRALAEAVLDHVMDVVMYNTRKIVDALGHYVQVLGLADDLGTEEIPQISVQVFRDIYKHRYEEIFTYIKKYSKAYTFLHSDGAIYPLIRELINTGLDILNPIQISARGMEAEKLKKEFGEELTFWGGGVDTQHTLPFRKEEEIVEHVKKLIKIFAPGGGYVFAPVHNIQPNTPPENIAAVFKTAYYYGKYPILDMESKVL
jgi:uroporphyrinogen decarboxylase